MPFGNPELLQHDFTAGIRRERSRDDLGRSRGANVLWDCKDWIVGRLGAPLGKRGGWGYQGAQFSNSIETPGRTRAIVDGPFNGGHYALAIDEDGNVYRSSGGAGFATWEIDATTENAGIILSNPVFMLDNLIIPSDDGSNTVLQANENTVIPLATGTYKPQYVEPHRGRLWGIDGEILIAGPPGNPNGAWDDNGAYDISQPGKGLMSLNRNMLIFTDGSTYRLSGSTPGGYGATADDIDIQMFASDIGIIDGFAHTIWEGNGVWVDRQGVWVSDGNTIPVDLTYQGHAKDLFLEFISNWTDEMRVACGIYSDLLLVSMTNTADSVFVDCLVCDMPRRVWYRFTNCPFTAFARKSKGAAETWAAYEGVDGRVVTLSDILNPTDDNMADANGTVVEPSFESAYYRFGPQPSRVPQLFLGYEIDFVVSEGELSAYNFLNGDLTIYVDGAIDWNGHTCGVNVQAMYSGVTVEYVTNNYLRLYIEVDVATYQDVADAIEGNAQMVTDGFTVDITPGEETTVVAITDHDALGVFAGGTDDDIGTPVTLKVDFSTDPRAAPAWESYNSDLIELEPRDIHGAADSGYHWKPVPVRDQSPGVAVRVRQSGASIKTSIHSLGSENQPYPSYSQV